MQWPVMKMATWLVPRRREARCSSSQGGSETHRLSGLGSTRMISLARLARPAGERAVSELPWRFARCLSSPLPERPKRLRKPSAFSSHAPVDEGGIILIDPAGNPGFHFNTPSMAHAYMKEAMPEPVVGIQGAPGS